MDLSKESRLDRSTTGIDMDHPSIDCSKYVWCAYHTPDFAVLTDKDEDLVVE